MSSIALKETVPIDRMLYDVLVQSLQIIRTLKMSSLQNGAIDTNRLYNLPAWRRGEIVSAAQYIVEQNLSGRWSIPRGAVALSRQVILAEEEHVAELEAAAVAGIPWMGKFEKKYEVCIRCGGPASWRSILPKVESISPEKSWRLGRPENHVPLCRRCVKVTRFDQDESVRFDLAWGLWARRFEALHQWYLAAQYGRLPEWDKDEYPLWPAEYGGEDWSTGSGLLRFCSPRPPKGIKRRDEHYAALARSMGEFRKRREEFPPYFSGVKLQKIIFGSDI